jgi:cell shape-determining protein MreC
MLFAWWRSRREALDLAETLERENERLRAKVEASQRHEQRMLELCRALRDVNTDLDRKLLEATHGQG